MSTEKRIDDLLQAMTLEEKASLCSGEGYWFTKSVPRLGLDRIMITDGPHGLRRQVGAADHLGLNKSVPSTCFPAGATIANSWDEELTKRLGELIADEALSEGVHVVLGPAINIKRSPLCGRNFEYYSEDPFLTGKLAASYIRGVQSRGIGACPKHYAVNNQERLRMMIDAVVDERTLREIYLLPFEYAVKEGGAKTIMSSYNLVNGAYANEHPYLLDTLLQQEWGFNGVIISDWGASNDRVEGLIAGNQLEMPTTMGETDAEIVEAVKCGKISMELLDMRLRPLLRLMLETQHSLRGDHQFSQDAHHIEARVIAEKSMVLLKNREQILPLQADDTVAIIGDLANIPRYQGAGSSIVNPTKLDSPLTALKESGLRVIGYEKGYKRYGKRSSSTLVRRAVKLATKVDKVILFLGLDESTEAEGIDRNHTQLRETQVELLREIHKVNSEIVVVLSGGSVVDMSWDTLAKGVLHGYLGGQAGAYAIANILRGTVNPSGKLAETYPYAYEDIASSTYYPGGYQTTQHREGLYVGYRYFDTAGIEPKYPFGFGLSYTTFTYSNLQISSTSAEFTLTNSGPVAGEEICQLYVSALDSQVFRPEKELKGFVKVSLQPGESQKICIPFDEKSFAYYNITDHDWRIEEGNYRITIGGSSRDLSLTGTLWVHGDPINNPYETMEIPSYLSGTVTHVSDKEFFQLVGREVTDLPWSKDQPVTVNSSVLEAGVHPGVGRFIYRMLRFMRFFVRDSNIRKATYLDASLYMPFRALARMSNGMMTMPMVEGLLLMINKGLFKGLGPFMRAWRQKKHIQKLYKKTKTT